MWRTSRSIFSSVGVFSSGAEVADPGTLSFEARGEYFFLSDPLEMSSSLQDEV